MLIRRLTLVLLCALTFACEKATAQWTVDLAKDSTAVLRYNGTRAMSFKYIAWAGNWKFAGVKTAMTKPQDGAYPFTGECGGLNTAWKGTIAWKDKALVYDWTFVCSQPSDGNIGGALANEIRLDPAVFNVDKIDSPAVNTDEKGWTWTPVPGQTVAVTFDNLPGKVAFEKGKASNIRAWIIPGKQEPGEVKVRMTIALPPGTQFNGLATSRYADFDPKTWLANTLDWTTSPIDLSTLNAKPAGSKGFVKVEGDHFVYGDGTEAKFWGCNVAAFALFDATNAAIEQQAKRIAALGYNLVRIHHHDSANWSPSVFVKDSPDTQHLDAKQLDRIDYWVKCLKDQGVYVWLDLHVGRPFLVGDNIPGFGELQQVGKNAGRQGKGFNYVNDRITLLMKDFAKQYLDRTNPYTGLKYTDEPAVMGVLITNENDLTDHFGNDLLPNKPTPVNRAMFEPVRDKIIAALGLNAKTAWQNWLPGQSKIVLNEIQYKWSKDFIDYLHGIGVKVPITTTSTWGSDPLFSLPALTAGDMIDVHSYGTPESMSGNPRADNNFTTWIAAAQVLGKPLTVTEWNVPFPSRDRFTAPMYMAAEAGLQGWDAPMIFGYQQSPLVPQTKLSEWVTSDDPAITALMPAAALMYRRGDVAPAKTTAVLSLPVEQMLYEAVSPGTSRAIRTLAEQHRLTIAMPQSPLLPWLAATPAPAGALVVTDYKADTLPADATSIDSDTGELSRNWKAGTFTINTPRTQAAMGWIGGQEIALGDVTFKLATSKATVVVSSLDNQPIATSKKMLLSAAAQVNTSGKPGAPILSEPVTGSVVFKTPLATAIALTPQGREGPAMKMDGGTIELPADVKTHWFLLTR